MIGDDRWSLLLPLLHSGELPTTGPSSTLSAALSPSRVNLASCHLHTITTITVLDPPILHDRLRLASNTYATPHTEYRNHGRR